MARHTGGAAVIALVIVLGIIASVALYGASARSGQIDTQEGRDE